MLNISDEAITLYNTTLKWPMTLEQVSAVIGQWSRVTPTEVGNDFYTWDDLGIELCKSQKEEKIASLTFYLYKMSRNVRVLLWAPDKAFAEPVFINDTEIIDADSLRDRTDLLDCIGDEPAVWDELGQEDSVVVPLGDTRIDITADFDEGGIISICVYSSRE